MENLPALSTAQLPAYLSAYATQPSALTAGLLTGEAVSVPRISLKQGRFRIREGQDEFVLDTPYLDAVIVGVVPGVSKTFYAKPWNPGDEPTAPDCYSILGDKPAADAKAPVCESCAACPNNVWGSKVTQQGTETKLCSDSRRIAVVPASDPEKVYLMIIPAASKKFLTKYVKELSLRGFKPELVRTRMTFDTEASFPLLHFTFGGFASDDVIEEVMRKVGSAEVNDVLGLFGVGVQQPTRVPVAQLAQTPRTQLQAAPAPAPAPAPAAEAPKRTGFGRPAGSKNKNKEAPIAAPDLAQSVRGFGGAQATAAAPVAATASPELAELEADIDGLLGR